MKTSDEERYLRRDQRGEKDAPYRTKIRMTSDFSLETIQARRQWSKILEVVNLKFYIH